MASGVTVDDEVVALFNEMKLKHHHKCITFKIGPDLKSIVKTEEILKTAAAEFGDEQAQWARVCADHMQEKDCCYCVYDFHYTTNEGGERNKLVLITWVHECAKIKHKMLYASSKDALRRKLVGVHQEIQATDKEELSYAEIIDKLSEGGKK